MILIARLVLASYGEMNKHVALLPLGEPLGGKKRTWVAIYPPGPGNCDDIPVKSKVKPTSASSVANLNASGAADKNHNKDDAMTQGCINKASEVAGSNVQDSSLKALPPPKRARPILKPTSKWKPRNN